MKFPSDENVLHEARPDPKLILIWFFTRSIVHGLWVGFSLFAAHAIYLTHFGEKHALTSFVLNMDSVLLMTALAVVAGTAVSYLYVRALINTITFYVTDRRCVWKGGIVKKVVHSTSFIKVTDVERSQNLLEQLLGITTLNLFTPGTSSMRSNGRTVPDVRFEGLSLISEEVAQTINEGVRRYGSAQT